MQKFFLNFKLFCLTFFASISFILIIVFLRQKLVSREAFEMSYPEVVFVNKVAIDNGLAVASLRDVVAPFLEQRKLLDVDIDTLYDSILGLPWVERVAVVRDFPDVLKIIIESKKVVAYKVVDGLYYPVSNFGKVLDVPVEYERGFLLFGDFSEENFPELLNFLSGYPGVLNKVAGFQFVNGLRWNLLLYSLDEDGMLIKLDNSYEGGIKKLAELDLLQGILSKNIVEIDLRDLDKILVKQRGNYGVR